MKRMVLVVALVCAGSVMAGEERYLSNAGDDAKDGRTPETAWRTTEKLTADLPAGATAYLRRGDVFYGNISLKDGNTLTAYGKGPKPVVSETRNFKNDPKVWESIGHCFWRVNMRNPTNFTGLVSDNFNPGFLLVDGEVKAWKRYCHDDLVSPWDFSEKDGYLYVHATNNPAILAKDIRCAFNVHAITFRTSKGVRINNIAVKGTGAHGMYGGWQHDAICEDVRIEDCDFENIGGSELLNYSPKHRIRYGNGIEFGSNCRNAVVERCTFKGVYDVAITMQGYPTLTSWEDIHIRNCTMTDCTQAFEIWCQRAPKGMGFKRCSFTGNHTVRVGGGWGPVVRPMRAVSTPLLIYGMDTDTVDIDVSGNTFEGITQGLIYKSGGLDKIPAGYRIHDNIVK